MSKVEGDSDSECSSGSPRPKTPEVESEMHIIDMLSGWERTIHVNIPTFSCLTVELRHIKIRWWSPKTKRHCDYDTCIFMQEDPSICDVVPATATVTNACFVDVSF